MEPRLTGKVQFIGLDITDEHILLFKDRFGLEKRGKVYVRGNASLGIIDEASYFTEARNRRLDESGYPTSLAEKNFNSFSRKESRSIMDIPRALLD